MSSKSVQPVQRHGQQQKLKEASLPDKGWMGTTGLTLSSRTDVKITVLTKIQRNLGGLHLIGFFRSFSSNPTISNLSFYQDSLFSSGGGIGSRRLPENQINRQSGSLSTLWGIGVQAAVMMYLVVSDTSELCKEVLVAREAARFPEKVLPRM